MRYAPNPLAFLEQMNVWVSLAICPSTHIILRLYSERVQPQMNAVVLPRAITAVEAAVIRAIVAHAPCNACLHIEDYAVDALQVIEHCKCGCDSVFFAGFSEPGHDVIVADGLGYTADGDEVNVILWANGNKITQLELAPCSESLGRLPLPESVCTFEESRRIRE